MDTYCGIRMFPWSLDSPNDLEKYKSDEDLPEVIKQECARWRRGRSLASRADRSLRFKVRYTCPRLIEPSSRWLTGFGWRIGRD